MSLSRSVLLLRNPFVRDRGSEGEGVGVGGKEGEGGKEEEGEREAERKGDGEREKEQGVDRCHGERNGQKVIKRQRKT
jgi:hypothetical protein